MEIRGAELADLDGLLQLYTQLHDNPMPEKGEQLSLLWGEILQDRKQHIIVGVENGEIISSCVAVIVPNLTHRQRPYCFVENVITSTQYRKKGCASALLQYARKLAAEEKCYKVMLLTGSKEESTLNFYRKSGYNSSDKTAFIQWL